MKNSAIKEILSGLNDRRGDLRFTKEDKRELRRIIDLQNEIKQKLSPEDYELYTKLIDLLEERHGKKIDFSYEQGFKLGVRVGIECTEGE